MASLHGLPRTLLGRGHARGPPPYSLFPPWIFILLSGYFFFLLEFQIWAKIGAHFNRLGSSRIRRFRWPAAVDWVPPSDCKHPISTRSARAIRRVYQRRMWGGVPPTVPLYHQPVPPTRTTHPYHRTTVPPRKAYARRVRGETELRIGSEQIA